MARAPSEHDWSSECLAIEGHFARLAKPVGCRGVVLALKGDVVPLQHRTSKETQYASVLHEHVQ